MNKTLQSATVLGSVSDITMQTGRIMHVLGWRKGDDANVSHDFFHEKSSRSWPPID
jgi:hypothetical protein